MAPPPDPTQALIVLKLEGVIDAQSALEFEDRMGRAVKEMAGHLIIDCRQLEYLSSAGIGVMISHINEMTRAGRRIVLVGVSEQIRTILQLLTLDHVFSLIDTLEEAELLCHS